jgi:hypothetical protein
VSVTMQPAPSATSAELLGLLDQAQRLASSAGRGDLVDRLNRARARVSGRNTRIVVVGAPGQGASSLARALDQTPPDQRPAATFTDASGRHGQGPIPIPDASVADAVLFVSDAGHEYGPAELDALARIKAQGLSLAGVITKIDAFPRWAEVQQANRRRLQAANLDSPSIPLLPVSAALLENGRQRGDESMAVASGVPQLIDFLRERMSGRVDPQSADAVLGEVRMAADQLEPTLGGNPAERQQRAVAELERRQQLSVNWQLALGDGATELMAQVEHDLRDRLRGVVRVAEAEITKANPIKRWSKFDAWVRGKVDESVRANFQLTREQARRLAEKVAGQLTGNPDAPPNVALPDVRVHNPDEALRQIKGMELPESAKGGMLARVINSLRGSYGGVLMVGVLTSLAGMVLINAYSIIAGILLGVFTFWEDQKNGKERSKAESKMAVSKLMDEVIFQIGDESRAQLRGVHRALRDHFTVLNDQRLRAASDAVRAASDPAQQGGQGSAELAELRATVGRLSHR